MRRRALLFVTIAVAMCVGGCLLPSLPRAAASDQGNPQSTAAPDSDDEPRPRTDGRLPDLAVPTRYELDLAIDPREARFAGTATITVLVRAPTKNLVLHARDLAVAEVSARVGREVIPGTASSHSLNEANADELLLRFARPLPRGPVTVRFAYDAPFSPRDQARGVFRAKTAAGWFAFTQFEPTDARRMFPNFDEPSYKASFEITVTVPAGMGAFSNMPEVSRVVTEDGIRFRFAPTPPLPSYSVALAVGDFDVDVGSSAPVPIRLLRPRGAPGRSRLALDAAEGLVGVLGEYLGTPYPFPKLDLVAVPSPFGGAMENAGLITFNESWLLPDSKRASTWDRTWLLQVIAHELAHQWAGNLVTLRWWDETWLNEGLATFLEARALERWRSSFGARLRAAAWIDAIMDRDARGAAREVRELVVTTADAERVLHGKIEYEKGAAFLFMLERFIGEADLRAGLRDYLQQHAWKNAATSDLISALEKASGRPLVAFGRSFLDRPGMPIVEVKSTCAGDRLESIVVLQEQLRFDSAAESNRDDAWSIPFCWSALGSADIRCEAISSKKTALSFGKPNTPCPRWLDPNPKLAGYYRYAVTREQLEHVEPIVGQLDVDAKLGLLYNAWASVARGRLGADALLRFLRAFDDERSGYVLSQVLLVLTELRELVGDEAEGAFRVYLARRARGLKSRLEPSAWFERARGDLDDEGVLRRVATLKLLGMADDRAVVSAAEEAALRWLKSPSEPPIPDLGEVALSLGVQNGRAAIFEGLVAEVKRPSHPDNRLRALVALGNVRSAALLRSALDLVLLPDLSAWEAKLFLASAAARPASRRVLFDWIVSEWKRVGARWSGSDAWPVVELIARACKDEDRERLERLFEGVKGSQASFEARTAEATRCRDRVKAGRGAVTSYLLGALAADER